MKKPIFSASISDAPAARKRDQYVESMRVVDILGDFTAADLETFTADCAIYKFANSRLEYRTVGASSVDNTRVPKEYAKPVFKLVLLMSGTFDLEVDDKAHRFQSGDCFVASGNIRFRTHAPGPFEMMGIPLPEKFVESYPDAVRQWAATPIEKVSLWGGAAASVLKAIAEHHSSMASIFEDELYEQIVCLLSLAANQSEETAGNYHDLILKRFRKTIAERLSEADFTAAKLAALHRVSLRMLFYIFANSGSSFTDELRSARLQHAQMLLNNSAYDRKTIAEISALCGFSHATHFSTSFRTAYGVTPREYRIIRKS